MRTGHTSVSSRGLIAGFLLIVAILFGGGGSPAPVAELVVQVAALIAIVAWAWLGNRDRTSPPSATDWPLLVLAALFVAIPLLQLVPLPPAIWHQLPGRETERQALALVGAENAWMPLSVSPAKTLASLLSLVPPMAMLYFTTRLTVRERSGLLGLLAALALLSVVVGVIQLASGHGNWLRFYSATNYGVATGFQASRNAQADLLIVSSMAFAAWAVTNRRIVKSRQAWIAAIIVVFVLWLAVVVTGSRSGVVMIVIALATCLAIAVRQMRLPGRRIAIIAVGALSLLGVTGVVLHDNVRVERTLARFDDLKDVRPEIWADTWYAIGLHWPAGTGMGTFRPVFDSAERLEFVRPSFANRAHNDYLEYLLETGIAGALLFIVAVIFAIYRVSTAVRRDDDRNVRVQALFVVGSLLVFVLHSMVDYPMRSMSLGVVAGLLCGLLSRTVLGSDARAIRSARGV
ncbi:O-antigen ligase [Hephaestia caeni]|uniref:O-antigen ligase n=1 Tax=Hephaestia caeni TaxID=645617 RepID=A0A397P5L4_9SPHN|nr:O-antigen ligase family protein [Hephaestia caeni]RIA43533.1 O-antigen ligase [Hephaestia caeni]